MSINLFFRAAIVLLTFLLLGCKRDESAIVVPPIKPLTGFPVVAKMDAKLLEKIEELTLYSIQLEKNNQQLRTEVDDLKGLVKQLLEKK